MLRPPALSMSTFCFFFQVSTKATFVTPVHGVETKVES